MITRRTLADAIDRLDDQIAELQREKAETYAAYRAQIENTGSHKAGVKLELAAVKAAIRKRQKLAADHDTVTERDDLVDQIVVEITAVGTSIATRTRATRDPASKVVDDEKPPQTAGFSTVEADKPAIPSTKPAPVVSIAPRMPAQSVVEPDMPDFLRRERVSA